VGEEHVAEVSSSAHATSRLAALYEEHLPVVFGFCRARLPLHDAEDVTAEVFRVTAEQLAADPGAELNTAWFLTAARNRIVDRWRREQRWRPRLAVLAAGSRWEADGGDVGSGEVIELLDALPVMQRAVLLLHHVDGYPVKEVAALLDRSPRAVESLLARGRRAMAAALGDDTAAQLVQPSDGGGPDGS
jgi:RNA polymerase sigma-70 factor (ECF subfamily)